MSLVVAEDLSKTYLVGEVQVQALKGVSFSIDEGTFVSFVGPSGSGKTTLLNLIGCLDKPSSGRIIVNGTEIAELDLKQRARFRGRNIGFIFQNFNLIPVLTVYENVEYPLVMVQSVPVSEKRRRVLELLNDVGMSEHRQKRPDQLSGGQKQRVAVARALITAPALVLADEPTANLDRDTARNIMNLMRRMKDERNTTFIFSTHDTRIISEVEIIHSLEDGVLVDGKESVSV
ncbi:ABC transporter ATP-binding protein [candidate division KSB1 bacterium]